MKQTESGSELHCTALRCAALHLLRVDLGGALVKARASLFGCYDGLEIVAFPPFLLTVAICSQRGCGCDFLGLGGDGLFDVGAIHHREGGSGSVCCDERRWKRGLPLNQGSRLRRNCVV